MKSKTFLTLAICAVAASLFSGCSTQKTRTGRNNSFFGGLVSYNTGSYMPVGPNSVDVDATQFLGRVNPSGDQLSFGYGALNLRDY
jgi:outer membrane protein assembly factor BamE (lipoprotein component of BamABCDE complex)